jgi:hypothetical protein
MSNKPKTDNIWQRCSAVAEYPGFTSYLEICGERTRFVIDAKIEYASEVSKLQHYVEIMASILALRQPSQQTHIEEIEQNEPHHDGP